VALVTRFLPERFDWYMAWSAKSKISGAAFESVRSVPQIPILAVTTISPPGLAFSIASLIVNFAGEGRASSAFLN
jgi:hypothetical protein